MFFSAADIHSTHQRTLEYFHDLSHTCLDYSQRCLDLGGFTARRWMLTGLDHVKNLDSDTPLSQWLESGSRLAMDALEEDVPAAIVEFARASRSCAEEIRFRADRHITEVRSHADACFDQGLQWSPWELFWIVESAKRTADSGFDAATEVSDLSFGMVDRFDGVVESELTPKTQQRRKTPADDQARR